MTAQASDSDLWERLGRRVLDASGCCPSSSRGDGHSVPEWVYETERAYPFMVGVCQICGAIVAHTLPRAAGAWCGWWRAHRLDGVLPYEPGHPNRIAAAVVAEICDQLEGQTRGAGGWDRLRTGLIPAGQVRDMIDTVRGGFEDDRRLMAEQLEEAARLRRAAQAELRHAERLRAKRARRFVVQTETELDGRFVCLRYIYALVGSHERDRVRYVGRTGSPHSRFRAHLDEKGDWVRELDALGAWPIMRIIETCDASVQRERERYWIAFYSGQGQADLNRADLPVVMAAS